MGALRKAKVTAEEIAETLGELLKNEIPGVDTFIVSNTRHAVLNLHYHCPCGEISGVECEVTRADAYTGVWSSVDFVFNYIERVKRILRSHVRSEGNEPNF